MGIDSRGIRVNTTKHNRPEPASMKVGSGLLAVVIHFDFACCCCQRVLSHGLLLLSFSLVGVVVFSFAVVTPDHTVAVLLAAAGHKERAARDTLISESPWFQAILPFWQPHLIVYILGFTFQHIYQPTHIRCEPLNNRYNILSEPQTNSSDPKNHLILCNKLPIWFFHYSFLSAVSQ